MPDAWYFEKKKPLEGRKGGTDSFTLPDNIDTFVREVVQNVCDQRVGAQVDVRFDVVDVSGDELKGLLALIGWDQGLREHLESVRDNESHLSGTVVRALSAVEAGKVRVMTVSDNKAWGLEGDEAEDGNFTMLCRHSLVTDSTTKSVGGGSFGLGKSVLWAFSNASTVLFSSLPKKRDDSGDNEAFRFFGRSYLPSHKIDGIWHNPDGYFGSFISADQPLGPGIISVRADAAKKIVKGTSLERRGMETGTSILVPFFGIPTQEEQPTLAQLKKQIVEAIQNWFWPAIHAGVLNATVATGNSRPETVAIAPWTRSFISALNDDNNSPSMEDVGQTQKLLVPIEVPARKVNPKYASASASATLCLRRTSPEEIADLPSEMGRTVALVRGAQMVVQYASRGISASVPDFVGVLQVGTYRGDTDGDRALEALVRDSEPPAHNEWQSNARKLADNYQGAQRALSDFLSEVWHSVNSALGARNNSSEAPKKLAELLSGKRKAGTKSGGRTEQYQMIGPVIDRSNPDSIVATMTLKRNRGSGPWHAKVGVALIDETGSNNWLNLSGGNLEILAGEDTAFRLSDDNTRWQITCTTGSNEVELRVTADVKDSSIARRAMATARAYYFAGLGKED